MSIYFTQLLISFRLLCAGKFIKNRKFAIFLNGLATTSPLPLFFLTSLFNHCPKSTYSCTPQVRNQPKKWHNPASKWPIPTMYYDISCHGPVTGCHEITVLSPLSRSTQQLLYPLSLAVLTSLKPPMTTSTSPLSFQPIYTSIAINATVAFTLTITQCLPTHLHCSVLSPIP